VNARLSARAAADTESRRQAEAHSADPIPAVPPRRRTNLPQRLEMSRSRRKNGAPCRNRSKWRASACPSSPPPIAALAIRRASA